MIYFTWATFSDTLCFIFATLGRKMGPRLSLAGPSLSLPGSQSMSFRLSENLVRFLASWESLDAWFMTLARNRCPTPPVMRLNTHVILYTGKYSPRFLFCPFRSCCQQANLRLGEISQKIYHNHNFVLAYLRWGKTICKWKEAKITLYIYSNPHNLPAPPLTKLPIYSLQEFYSSLILCPKYSHTGT